MHQLLTKEIRERLPKLYATQDERDPVVQVKFYSLYIIGWWTWTWYATEFDGEDTFFGLVDGFEQEWGNFSLSKLESRRGPGDIPLIERDRHFDPARISDLEIKRSVVLLD